MVGALVETDSGWGQLGVASPRALWRCGSGFPTWRFRGTALPGLRALGFSVCEPRALRQRGLGIRWLRVLGGSGVVISRVISPLVWVISIVTLLITLLITTHEPPSKGPCTF